MKRALLVLLLGVASGTAAHLGYFHLRRTAALYAPDSELVWIRSELNLSDAQYAQIKELHESSGRQLQDLAGRVTRLQAELAAFETERRDTDKIDFIAFAKFLDEQRAMDRQYAETTRMLVDSTARLMTPSQRKRYLTLVALDGLVPQPD
jgi:hypothetical protein